MRVDSILLDLLIESFSEVTIYLMFRVSLRKSVLQKLRGVSPPKELTLSLSDKGISPNSKNRKILKSLKVLPRKLMFQRLLKPRITRPDFLTRKIVIRVNSPTWISSERLKRFSSKRN